MAAIDTTKLRQLLDGPWGGDMPERSALRQLLAAYDEQGERLERAEAERDRLKACVSLLRPEDAEHFWHLYRTHPFLAGGVST